MGTRPCYDPRMRRIYIAGPFRGSTPWEVEENIRRAERKALAVARGGDCPVCPHTMWRHFDKALPDEFWLEAAKLLLETCRGVVLVEGWENSAGTRAEIQLAKDLGLWVLSPERRPV